MPAAFSDNENAMCVPVVTTEIISRHCQMPPGRQKSSLVENHCIRLRPETCYHWISCNRRKLNPYLCKPLESGVLLLADRSISHNVCTDSLWPTTTGYWMLLCSPLPIQALTSLQRLLPTSLSSPLHLLSTCVFCSYLCESLGQWLVLSTISWGA